MSLFYKSDFHSLVQEKNARYQKWMTAPKNWQTSSETLSCISVRMRKESCAVKRLQFRLFSAILRVVGRVST